MTKKSQSEETEDRGEKVPVHVVDRRRFRSLEDAIESEALSDLEPSSRRPAYVEEIEARLRASEERLEETLSAFRRQQSEMGEVRARLDRDFEARVDEAKARVFRRILEVADDMDLALDHTDGSSEGDDPVAAGVRKIRKKLLDVLAQEGVEPLDVQGEPFDPACAEAIAVAPVDDPEQHDCVVRVLQQGYRLREKVLRPARVQVGKYSGEAVEEG